MLGDTQYSFRAAFYQIILRNIGMLFTDIYCSTFERELDLESEHCRKIQHIFRHRAKSLNYCCGVTERNTNPD